LAPSSSKTKTKPKLSELLHVGLLQGCTNSGCLVYRATKLCTVQPNIFNRILAVFPYTKLGVTGHMQQA